MEKIILKNIYNDDIQVNIVDSQEEANFITHSGTFHADEVMSSVILLNKFGSLNLYRCNKPTNKNAFIYDVGFGIFDHHSIDFDLKRENGIKYASCGLIWKEFGYDIIDKLNVKDKKLFFDLVDKNLIMDIDRDDNGQNLLNNPEIKQQTIPSLISSFNPSWNEDNKEDICFLNAVYFANSIFNNLIKNMLAKQDAMAIVEEKIEESKDGILMLDRYMPWKDIVLLSSNPKAKDILYAIFPSKRGGYNIVATPKEIGSFEVKKAFPSSWAGMEDKELQEISGIKTITFCHKSLFICACDKLDDAFKIARVSIENNL